MSILIVASGGTGDLITGIALEHILGESATYATPLWERSTLDPKPGPRARCEVLALAPDAAGWRITPKTSIVGGYTSLPLLAASFGSPIYFLDILSPAPLAAQISQIIKARKITHVFLVDTGGDVLARRPSDRLLSPLMDALMLTACRSISDAEARVAVGGAGLDGEHDAAELDAILRDLGLNHTYTVPAALGMYLHRRFASIPSEASLMMLLAAAGLRGSVAIRWARTPYGGYSPTTVRLTPMAGRIVLLAFADVAAHSGPASVLPDSTPFYEARKRLITAGYVDELGGEQKAVLFNSRGRDIIFPTPPSIDFVSRRSIAKALRITSIAGLSGLTRALNTLAGPSYQPPILPVSTYRKVAGRLCTWMSERD